MPQGHMYRQMNTGYGSLIWTWGVPIILISLILLAIYMIFKNNKENKELSKNEKQAKTTKAFEILDERYAKGEIDEEEYQRMKNNLNE